MRGGGLNACVRNASKNAPSPLNVWMFGCLILGQSPPEMQMVRVPRFDAIIIHSSTYYFLRTPSRRMQIQERLGCQIDPKAAAVIKILQQTYHLSIPPTLQAARLEGRGRYGKALGETPAKVDGKVFPLHEAARRAHGSTVQLNSVRGL